MPDFQREMFNEEDEDRNNWWNINAGDVVIDAGAGTGSWALPAAALGGHVVAFECDPFRVNALLENVKANPGMQMTIDSHGLYSSECELDMDVSSSSVMLKLGYQPSQKVKMTTLDKFYEEYQLNRCDMIKVDVEGSELHVLSGALKTITKYKPKIIVEAHTFIIPDIAGHILGFINRTELFYRCEVVLRRSKPGSIDLRSYTFPRMLFTIDE